MPTTTAPAFSCSACGAHGSKTWMLNHDCSHNQYVNEHGGRCEDFPACGHTDGDGCRQLESHTADFWRNDPHLLCNHEAGHCEADYDANDDGDCSGDPATCQYGGCGECDDPPFRGPSDEGGEDAHLDASYEDQWGYVDA